MPDFTREEIEEIMAARKLEKANLVGIDLSGAKLSGADLRRSNLSEATYDNKTEFPAGFDPEAAGMVLVE